MSGIKKIIIGCGFIFVVFSIAGIISGNFKQTDRNEIQNRTPLLVETEEVTRSGAKETAIQQPQELKVKQFGTVIDQGVGTIPNAFSFSQSRSVCVDPVSGITWVFYLKRTVGKNPEWWIAARSSKSWDKAIMVVPSPAPDFTISCKPPFVWLVYADANAMRIYLRRGRMNNDNLEWNSPNLVADLGLSFAAQTPSLAWLPDGRPVIAYWGNDKKGFFQTMASVAHDTDGRTWGPSMVLASGDNVYKANQPSVAVWTAKNTIVALSYHDPQVFLNRWLGDKWSSPLELTTDMANISQASGTTGKDGKVHIVYRTKDKQAKYTTLTPEGLSEPVDLGPSEDYETCIAMDGPDFLAIYGRINAARIHGGKVLEIKQIFNLSEETIVLFTQCNEEMVNGQLMLAWTEGSINQSPKIVIGMAQF